LQTHSRFAGREWSRCRAIRQRLAGLHSDNDQIDQAAAQLEQWISTVDLLSALAVKTPAGLSIDAPPEASALVSTWTPIGTVKPLLLRLSASLAVWMVGSTAATAPSPDPGRRTAGICFKIELKWRGRTKDAKSLRTPDGRARGAPQG
jgi:hypothetical protein